MSSRRFFSAATISCFLLLGFVVPAAAQFPVMGSAGGGTPGYPALSAAGTDTVKRLPGVLRVVITVQGQGGNVDEALVKLNAAKDSATEKLVKLGFDKEKLRTENFSLDQSQANRRQQMERMIAQRVRQPNQAQGAVAIPESVLLRCELHAEQPLAGKTVEELLKETQAVKEKIKAADFSPKPGELSPEEEELAEEMAGMNEYYSDESAPSTDPRYIYIAAVTEEEARDAYRNAFAQAEKQADFLAQAAGVRRGRLMQLSGTLTKGQASANPYMRHNEDYYLMQMLNAENFSPEGERQYECFALSPAAMTFTFTVQATFRFESGAEP